MKHGTSVAALVVICTLAGCASTRQEHMVSKDGVTLYCGSMPARSDGTCPTATTNDVPRAPPNGVYYGVERDQGNEPFDPGVIPNFGR